MVDVGTPRARSPANSFRFTQGERDLIRELASRRTATDARVGAYDTPLPLKSN